MKRLVLALALCAGPVAAEDGTSLMERGLELFFEGLMQEAEPALDEFRGFAEEIGPEMERFFGEARPVLEDLLEMIDDLGNYQAPERLPNGDIIIRRRPDAPLPKVEPEGIEL